MRSSLAIAAPPPAARKNQEKLVHPVRTLPFLLADGLASARLLMQLLWSSLCFCVGVGQQAHFPPCIAPVLSLRCGNNASHTQLSQDDEQVQERERHP
jgi:hypothetical protein